MVYPTKKTPQMLNKICEQIALGKSLRSICKDKEMPSLKSVVKWLNEDKDFQDKYSVARENRGDLYGEMINDIALEVLTGKIDWQRARVTIDALKWTSARMSPKKYGDRQDITVKSTSYVKELEKVQDTIRERIEQKNLEKSKNNVVSLGKK
tara:strand:+ start:801 stop:1256 length:456 start_codon:yes stop_codon:yes gene_type:complete